MIVGYYIYYGTSADALTQIISVTGSDTTTMLLVTWLRARISFP